ncbi:hypothetical protein PLEI_1466 [Photobacterium leiognathi lrivu.4.1]|uniref:Uncharacterized protein n=1 Tax=Photobacterium leiognathi lrivu.4.1 TaxID=1248232 RepID=A0A0U1P5Q2_PHOLE|nr:hypothetical protein [Photobacterium leiognathi]GAD29813.1 hypothetical protein PLEI_1466 [Photobacterium leiognathi lrivu.4.1]
MSITDQSAGIEEAQVVEIQTPEQEDEKAKQAELQAKYARFQELDGRHRESQKEGSEVEALSAEEIAEVSGLYTELVIHEQTQKIANLEETSQTLREANSFLREKHDIAGNFINAIANIVGFKGEEGQEIHLQKLLEVVKEKNALSEA